MKEFKIIYGKITEQSSCLERENQRLRQALHELLEEDDIKSIPGYKILKTTYETYLTEKQKPVPKSASRASVSANMDYDPLHAPPKVRHAALRASKAYLKSSSLQEPKSKPKPKIKQETSPVDELECMLTSTPTSKPKPKPKPLAKVEAKTDALAKVKAEMKVEAASEAEIYVVEIQGKQYYVYDTYLYHINSHDRCGGVTDQGFQFDNGECVPFSTEGVTLCVDPISKEYPNYYTDINRTKIYNKIGHCIVHAVGEVQDNELYLW